MKMNLFEILLFVLLYILLAIAWVAHNIYYRISLLVGRIRLFRKGFKTWKI